MADYVPVTKPWAWNSATPHERAEAVRRHLRTIGGPATADLFNLTENGLRAIRNGCEWKQEYERP